MVKKVTELPVATDVAQTDLIPIVDMSSTPVTKRVVASILRKLNILSGGVAVAVRPKLNFIAGSDTLVQVADNAANDRVDVTITTLLGPNSPAHKLYMFENFY